MAMMTPLPGQECFWQCQACRNVRRGSRSRFNRRLVAVICPCQFSARRGWLPGRSLLAFYDETDRWRGFKT